MSERNRTIALIGAIALGLLVVAGLMFAGLAGRDIDSFLPMLAGFATPTIVALLTAAGIRADLSQVKNDVAQVHKQVNGNYDRIVADRDDLARQLIERDGGRHRAPDDDEGDTLNLAADDTTSIHAVASPDVTAAAETRIVSGLVLPWDTIGHTTAGPLEISRGGTRLPRELSRCKLHFKHTGTEGHRPVGYATAYDFRDDGLHMSFKVAETPEGDAALRQITEGVFDAFSAELSAIQRQGNIVVDSAMTGVALVDTPAYADARISSIQAAFTPIIKGDNTTMNVEAFIRYLISQGKTDAEARTAAVANGFTQADVDAITIAPAAPAAPADQPPAVPALESAAAAYTPPRAAIVPAGVQAAPAAPTVVHASAHEAAQTLAMMVTGKRADVAHAALADITNSGMTDALPPGWLGEMWTGPAKTRKLAPLLNYKPLRHWRLQGFRWKEKPLVAEYAGDKTEIPTNPVSIEPYEAEATRWAGGHDLDRKFYDFGDAEILESYWAAMHESYAVVTDRKAGLFTIANAKAITHPKATDLIRSMVALRGKLDDAVGVDPSYYLANPDDAFALLDVTAANVSAFIDMFDVDPRKIKWSNAVPAGTLVAGARPAITLHELPGSPLRVEAEHISHGGRDRAMFGYTAFTVDNPDAIVKVNFGAATP
ncbi:hypothetical protein [Gordonia sp. CPCC 205333]|uniref:hypothetical protein n=1 Tax=Gordonia sp. CPCC 205333 TaxID=3140790 RepID=UPI003AF376D0